MTDFDASIRGDAPPASWSDAFAALPLEAAPAGGWAALARRLDASPRRRRPRWPLPLAAAAAALLAALVPWLPRQAVDQVPAPRSADLATQEASRTASVLEPLQAESARLEALLQYARDGRVASGSAAVLAVELDGRVAAIDAALRQPELDDPRRIALWRERVALLRSYAGFESTRRWLAANGERYDGALVAVD